MLGSAEKAKVFSSFFASPFAIKTTFQEPVTPKTRGKVWNKEELPLAEENIPRGSTNSIQASAGSCWSHL